MKYNEIIDLFENHLTIVVENYLLLYGEDTAICGTLRKNGKITLRHDRYQNPAHYKLTHQIQILNQNNFSPIMDDQVIEFLLENHIDPLNLYWERFILCCDSKYYQHINPNILQHTIIEHPNMNGEQLSKLLVNNNETTSSKVVVFYPNGPLNQKTMNHFLSLPLGEIRQVKFAFWESNVSDYIRFVLHTNYDPTVISANDVGSRTYSYSLFDDLFVEPKGIINEKWSELIPILFKHVKMGNNARQRDIPGFEQEMIENGMEEYL